MVKHTPIVTAEEENTLWRTKLIGDGSPLALQRAVFFYAGKFLCLSGGEEQRNLKLSQFVRHIKKLQRQSGHVENSAYVRSLWHTRP